MGAAGGNGGQNHIGMMDFRKIPGGHCAAEFVHAVQLRQLGSQKRRLQFVQTGVLALVNVVVFPVAAIVAQRPDAGGQIAVIGGDGPRVPQRAQIFAGVKAEPGGIAKAPRALAVIRGPVGLRRVLDEFEAVGVRDGAQRVHVGGLAVEMHRHDGFGAGGDGGLHKGGVDVVGGDVRLHQHRGRAAVAHRQHGGDEGVGGHDDLVPRTDAVGFENQHQRVQPVAAADAELRAAVVRKGALKGGVLLPFDVPAVLQHPVKGGAQRGVQLGLQRPEGYERYRHACSSCSRTNRKNWR